MRLTSLALALAIAAKAQGAPIQVYILAGQSNAVGFSSAEGLSSTYARPVDDILFRPIKGPFGPLQPVNGRFGPEIGFGRTMMYLTSNEVAIIKYAKGSTSLAVDWSAEGPEYQAMLRRVGTGLDYLASTGRTPHLAGLLWMQGEEDARHADYAASYAENLRDFVSRVQTDLAPMPIAIGKIAAPTRAFTDQVRAAQDSVADIPSVRLIETNDLELQDLVHYSPAGQVQLGKRFAFALNRDGLGVVAPTRHNVVPEPATGVLAALAGLVGWIWRKVR